MTDGEKTQKLAPPWKDDEETEENGDWDHPLYEDYSDKHADLSITEEDLALLAEAEGGPRRMEHSGGTVRLSRESDETDRNSGNPNHAETDLSFSEDELAELEKALADQTDEEEASAKDTGPLRHDPLDNSP